MARRREVQQQQKQEFLSSNPDLIEFETHIAPGVDECEDVVLPEVTTEEGESYFMEPEFFRPRLAFDTFDQSEDEGVIPGVATISPSFYGEGLVMSGSPMFREGPIAEVQSFGLEEEYDGPDMVAVTQAGFGVASYSETPETECDPETVEELGSLVTISGEERLFMSIDGIFRDPRMMEEYIEGPQIQNEEEPEEVFALEGRSLGFGIDVVGGSGSVVVEFMHDDCLITTETFMAGGASRLRGPAGESQFFVDPEEGFEMFAISTTGDLEIIVTEIDLTTGMGDPIDWWIIS